MPTHRRPSVRALVAVGLILAALIHRATPASAWSFEAHKFIVERAIELLPQEIRPFYTKHRVFVVEHSIDPDLWRTAGFSDEPPRHFLDLDAYGAFPFKALPRDYAAAVAKFGRAKVVKNGLLPWRVAEMYGKLAEAFEAHKGARSLYALDEAKFLSAVVAHYVADAHVPFHAVLNYDGQLTRQDGIHARFEAELFRRYRGTLSIVPPALSAVRQPRDFIFETLLTGFPLVEEVLKADKVAIGTRDVYDDRYFDAFLKDTRPILERRLAESIAAVASTIAGAWEQAGKPALPLDPNPPPQRIRR